LFQTGVHVRPIITRTSITNGLAISSLLITGLAIGLAMGYVPTPIWLGLIGFVLAIFLFWKRPDLGLIAIIISLPVYYYAYMNVYGLNIRVYNALSLVLMIILIARGRWRWPLLIPTLAYLGGLGFSVITSMDQLLSLKYILFQVFGLILMWATYNLTRTGKDFEKFTYLLLLAGNVDTLLIVLNTGLFLLKLPTFAPIMFTNVLPIGRPNLFLGEPDRTAEYHLVLLLICLPLVLLSGKWKAKHYLSNRFVWISFTLNLYIVLIGLFRSAWIGLALGLLTYIFLSSTNRIARFGIKRLVPVVVVGAMVVGLLLMVFPPFARAMSARFLEAADMIKHPRLDVQSDFSVIYVFFTRGLQRPWLGWGIGYDEVAIDPAKTFTYHLASVSEGYNRLVRMFFGSGIVGLAGFIIWQLAYFRRMVRKAGPYAYRLAMLLPVIGIYWGHDLIRAVGILPQIFIVMGLGLSLRRIAKTEEQTGS
jgi:hypothetical protein